MSDNNIQDIYKWNGKVRFISPEGQKIHDTKLCDIECPNCNQYGLEVKNYTILISFGYMVTCKQCGWMPKIYLEECPDEQSAMSSFELWLEAFRLNGSCNTDVNIDTRNLLNDPDFEI